jgi:polysaccharide biosynthesis/export protein VpsN
MKRRLSLCLLLPALLLGCASHSNERPSSASAAATSPGAVQRADNDLIRVGDMLSIRLSGIPAEDAAVYEVKVGDEGEVSMPLLSGTFHAAGLTTSQLKESLENAYRTRRVYSNPNITIVPELRYVNVNGEVRQPQRVPFTNDLTVLRAIAAAGGFTDYAQKHDVQLLRGSRVYHIDASKALKDLSLDATLQAGDQIQVPRSVF